MGLLRLLLALSVIADHTAGFWGNRLVGGPTAVQSFYMISGFYMALVLNEKYTFKGNYFPFLIQRILRLYPLYFVILGATLLWAWVGLHWTGTPYTNAVSWHDVPLTTTASWLLKIPQITLIGQDFLSFFIVSGNPGSLQYASHSLSAPNSAWTFLLVPQAWSISVELLFYCVAPFLVRLSVKRQLIFLSATLAIRAILYWGLGLNYDPWTHRFIPIELGIFVMGSLAYQFYARHRERLREMRGVAIAALAVIFVIACLYYSWDFEYKRPLFYLLVGVSLPLLFASFETNTTDKLIGEMSYPIYMVHMLVLYVAHSLLPHLSERSSGPVAAAFSIGASLALYFVILQPIERFRRWILKKIRGRRSKAITAPVL